MPNENSISQKSYKNFELVSEKKIPDCDSTALFFRHKKTGLEVFHLLNDDEENLFAFAFRTPNSNSSGAAHIVEHSVFCGSKKYPLKDPFINLESQSVQTFMNALTFPDKTVYPASSILEADYFNLMAVYADAVFFPNLNREVFLQEGHRIEFDERGKPSIQGVVFNEMKGAYSSFLDVAGKEIDGALFPDTVYAKSSGGDPLEIAHLSYEDFIAFHKKFYVAHNCLVFLYGNISTQKQLDFLQENILNEIEAKGNSQKTFSLSSKKKFLEEILKCETQRPFSKMRFHRATAPFTSGEKDSTAVVSWLLGESRNMDDYAEAVFLGSLLCAHDGSPLSSALLKSSLGSDISPCSGTDASIRQINFSAGLRGVKEKNLEKVKNLIFNSLRTLCDEGIAQDDIDATFNAIDFDNREIKRFQEPFSLVLMRRALRTWNYGGEAWEGLFVRDAFAHLKEKILANPDFIKKLIEEKFLKNPHCVFTIISPEKNFLKSREKMEKEILLREMKNSGKEKILLYAAALEKFQKNSGEDLSCLPHIHPKDLKVYDEKLKIRRTKIRVGKDDVPLFVSRENTNGIVYATTAFPMDVFAPEIFPYLPFFAYILNELGWGELRWDEASRLIAKTCGAFSTTSFSNSCPKSAGAKKMLEKNSAFAGRQWLFCKIKMLDTKVEESFDLMRDCILGANFDDKKRVCTLAQEMLNELESSILPAGHLVASSRAECRSSRECAIEEIWGGLCQVFTLRKICADIDGTIQKMKFIAKKIFSSGAIIHVCADEATLPSALDAVKKFARELNLKSPEKKFKASDSQFFELTNIGKTASTNDEAIFADAMVGFCALHFRSSKYGTREAVAEKVLAHILTSGALWQKLRTEGGAYGAFATSDSIDETFTLCTYRDPNPQKSLAALEECLEEITRTQFDFESVEKAVTGTYSGEIQPKTPSGRGTAAFLRQLYLLDNSEKLEQMRILKTISQDDISAAARRILRSMRRKSKRVVILQKNEKCSSNFHKIEL